MTHNLEIHTVLEERVRRAGPDWSIERAPALPNAAPLFRLHLDLQLGPIFITIGDKIVTETF
ncbi:MAG TPA: hypothetical protein DCG54_06265 [Anaerolineae bacterium]|jgi:hypothetical protein|nr:hypothetical protein [Anaerolineae bacterium]HAE59108.1 hypothetical protein [Anaerolineae bacterium]